MSSLPRRPFPLLVLVFLAALALTACGYQNTAKGPTPVLIPEEYRRLAITEVHNPTIQPALGFTLRSLLRDEFTRRGYIDWSEREGAKANLKVSIEQFSNTGRVKDADDRTLKFEIRLRLRARIISPQDNKLLWDSGLVAVDQSYFENERPEAETRALELAVRTLADRLGDAF